MQSKNRASCCFENDSCIYNSDKNKNICTNLCKDSTDNIIPDNIIPNNIKYKDKIVINDNYKNKNYFINSEDWIMIDKIESIGHYGSCCAPIGAFKNFYFGINKTMNKCDSME